MGRGAEFNFQRASCGLDASVKIYGKRVDSAFDTALQVGESHSCIIL